MKYHLQIKHLKIESAENYQKMNICLINIFKTINNHIKAMKHINMSNSRMKMNKAKMNGISRKI